MTLPLRVLLVDDSEDDAFLVLRELRRGGWEISHCRVDTAAAMIALLEKQSWDLIISDFSMPQFSGLAALTVARERAPDLPFILVSGTVGEQVAVVAMKAGAHDYIMKDSLTRLVPAVERELGDAKARRKVAQELREAQENLELRVIQRTAELAQANEQLRVEITERERAELRLNTLNEELVIAKTAAESANEAKSTFLANMSHEIRTPMAAVIGYADLLLDPSQNQSERLDCVNTIRRNGEHLLTIINDILDLSKIEAGKFHVTREQCSPCHVLGDVASLMRVRAVEKSIRLEVKNQGRIPASISTDAARLRQILINLVGNAIKFTDEGWVRVVVELEETPDSAPRLRFDVMDTGIGMSPQQVSKLFQPFVQADNSTTRRFGGTGLGLTISKRLAEMLGGSIEVNSAPGRGSTFTLFIDVGDLTGVQRVESCREALSDVSSLHPSDQHSIQLRGRVLLVDDGHDNRQLLSVYLHQAGAEVAFAENGRVGCEKALAALAEGQPFGVILMDMQMPELDGYSAAARLRGKGYTGPIIALTAHAMAEDRAKCLNAGCTDYLSKPVRRGELVEMVGRYLNPAGAMAESPSQDSSLAADPTLPPVVRSDLQDQSIQAFLDHFVSELPERVEKVQRCLMQGNLKTLAREVHDLRGAGGTFGFMPITQAAEKVEALIQARASLDSITAQVNQLLEIIRRVEGFNAATPAKTS